MTKSILFITVTFPPRLSVASLRIYNYAKLFADNGWKVTVITAAQKGENKSNEFDLSGITLIHVPWKDPFDAIVSFKNRFLGKVIFKVFSVFVPYLATWMPDLRFYSWRKNALSEIAKLKDREQFTHVFSSYSPPSPHMIASKLKKQYKDLFWVVEFRDLMSFSHSIKWWEYPFALIHNHFERRLLNSADEIVCVSRGHADQLNVHLKRKVNVLYNGCDFEAYLDIKNKNDDSFVIVYTGNVYRRNNDIKLFFNALSCVLKESNKNLVVKFIGTPKSTYLTNLVSHYNLNNYIEFIEKSEHSVVKEYQKSADILLHFCWKNESQTGNLTGKIFEYISARRPILSIGYQQELSVILNETQSGEVCRNLEEIKNFILTNLNSKQFLNELSNNSCFYSKQNQFKLLEKRILEH